MKEREAYLNKWLYALHFLKRGFPELTFMLDFDTHYCSSPCLWCEESLVYRPKRHILRRCKVQISSHSCAKSLIWCGPTLIACCPYHALAISFRWPFWSACLFALSKQKSPQLDESRVTCVGGEISYPKISVGKSILHAIINHAIRGSIAPQSCCNP